MSHPTAGIGHERGGSTRLRQAVSIVANRVGKDSTGRAGVSPICPSFIIAFVEKRRGNFHRIISFIHARVILSKFDTIIVVQGSFQIALNTKRIKFEAKIVRFQSVSSMK